MDTRKYYLNYSWPASLQECERIISEAQGKHDMLLVDLGLELQRAIGYLDAYRSSHFRNIPGEISKVANDIQDGASQLENLQVNLTSLQERQLELQAVIDLPKE